MPADPAVEAVRASALWIDPEGGAIDPLLDAIGDARVVLIGEASHGTEEFYRIRADLTAALIRRKSFNIVAAEADWPDAYRANRWVRLTPRSGRASATAVSSTSAPTFSGTATPPASDCRRRARTKWWRSSSTSADAPQSTRAATATWRKTSTSSRSRTRALSATRSSITVPCSEARAESWNLRDTHMMETLDALMEWARRRSGAAKAVVWAHNSHLGDARATDMSVWGELNVGQLARQQYGGDAYLIGFTTHAGTVTAARDWDEPAGRRQVRPSLENSYERLFHDVGMSRFLLLLGEEPARAALDTPRLERAIGVVYRPETERASHYFRARLPRQFDAAIHVDITTALTPLEPWSLVEPDLPETYPVGV